MTAKRSRGARSVWKAFDELTPEFAALITEFTKRPRVTYGGRGFGARGLRVGGKIFAMLDSKGRFVVKVPRIRADALLARGQAVHFEPVPGFVPEPDPAITLRPRTGIRLTVHARG